MSNFSRREFLRGGTLGLAALGTGGLILRADAQVTLKSGHAPRGITPPMLLAQTEPNIMGPFFRSQAPFRAKITPPLSSGVVMLIQGRVWSFQTKKPIQNAVLDIWQANAKGRYDNDDPSKPPAPNVFLNRARLITDESGYYEFETVHPGHYPLDESRLRPAHIHYRVTHPNHKTLVTQLYFKGDTHIEGDPFVRPSLIIQLKEQKIGTGVCERGIFDIVLGAKK
jgi:catechol 1,2-dioxygenase